MPSGRVYTALDALADPHYLARGMVQHLTSVGGTTMPVTGVVPRFSRTPGVIRSPGPALGSHDHLVAGLAELPGGAGPVGAGGPVGQAGS